LILSGKGILDRNLTPTDEKTSFSEISPKKLDIFYSGKKGDLRRDSCLQGCRRTNSEVSEETLRQKDYSLSDLKSLPFFWKGEETERENQR
jgi:hypothetical protein